MKDKSKGTLDMKIKGMNSEKLKRARNEIRRIKDENQQQEEEINYLRGEKQKFEEMKNYFNSELEKREIELNKYKIKENHYIGKDEDYQNLVSQIEDLDREKQEIIQDANSKITHLKSTISSLQSTSQSQMKTIESLQKQISDNEDFLTSDQLNYQKCLSDIDNYKVQLEEMNKELAEYKNQSESNPFKNKINIDKELNDQKVMFTKQIQSLKQQLDCTRDGLREAEGKNKSYMKQIKILEKNRSDKSKAQEVEGIEERVRDIFDIHDEEDLIEELETIAGIMENLKQENTKAIEVNQHLEKTIEEMKEKQYDQPQVSYSDELLKAKAEEIEYLKGEIIQANR